VLVLIGLSKNCRAPALTPRFDSGLTKNDRVNNDLGEGFMRGAYKIMDSCRQSILFVAFHMCCTRPNIRTTERRSGGIFRSMSCRYQV